VRTPCDGGAFLRARPVPPGSNALEHAMHSLAVTRLASGVVHDVKNPLNAMALQIALLTDKIGGSGEALAAACANNLASLRNQISRVNDVVRRLADVSDPAPASAFDLGSLTADVGSLFAHEARRRRVAWTCEAAAGSVHGRGDPARVARLLLGVAWRALSRAEGGAVTLRVGNDGQEAVVAVEHGPDTDPELAWVPAVAAEALAEMGGRLVRGRAERVERLELRLRRESAT
jgi:signal transduction histidine kinase